MRQRLWYSVFVGALSLLSPGCQRPPGTRPAAQVPASPGPAAKREPIFFLKGDGTLSPGALGKLKTWVEAWGVGGRWTLTIPTGPGLTYELMERRILIIRAELRKLGVPRIDTILGPTDPPGPYDAIYVSKEPS